MHYQSIENYLANMNQSAFFYFTDFVYKVDYLKQQAEYFYSDFVNTYGKPCYCLVRPNQEEESQKFVETEPIQQSISEELQKIKTQPRDNSYINKHRKVNNKSKKIQRNLNQKKQRNALTNLGSQLLTFIYLKKKNNQIIKEKFPHLTSEEAFHYYQWARKIKQSMNGYINIEKLKWVWHRKPEAKWEKLYLTIFRVLSLYYLNHLMVPAILTSKKIAEDGKTLHLGTRRKMLEAIYSTDQF